MVNHQEMYSTIEFGWAYLENLENAERYLIEHYLDPQGITVEAGTAGGRILLNMKKLGFTNLYGFDFVPGFIEVAKQRDTSHTIAYKVQNATSLDYDDCYFDQIVYLQQIMCCIDDPLGRLKAFNEAYRILKTGGTALFSFLSFDARIRSFMHLAYLAYLSILRKFNGSHYSIQYLPELRIGRQAKNSGKFNLSSLLDRGPNNYWYKLQEAYQSLREANFEIVAIGSDYQINQGRMHELPETLACEPLQGMLYFVCKKRA
jgi:ubiquinone/menaquinone biosynthesis C-methylase UbiE